MNPEYKVMDTELHAANSILERGIRAKVRAPFLLRVFGIKTIPVTLHKLYAGTLMRVSAHYLATGITDEDLKEISTEKAIELMARHGRIIYRAVACALLNSRSRDWLLGRLIAWYIRENMTVRDALLLLEVSLLYNGTSDFMTTTRYIRMMKLTDPTNLGHEKEKAKKAGS